MVAILEWLNGSGFIEHLNAHWQVLIGILTVLLAFLTSSHAVIRRRDSRAALWWVTIVWLLPVFGSFFYLIYGINRIERKASRLKRRKPVLEKPVTSSLLSRATDPERVSPKMRSLQSLARLVDNVARWPLLSGNRVKPLINGDQAYPAMVKAIDEARESIALCTYIFNNDRAGQPFIDALSRAVARGVEVRVLIDDVGSGFSWSSVYKELDRNKVPVAYFLPVLVPWRIAYLNLRNHRKILTVDGRVGFVGGMNITEGNLLNVHPRSPVSDIHFQLEGPVVAQLQETFREDWNFTTQEILEGPRWFPPLKSTGVVRARGIAYGPDEDFEKLHLIVLGALSQAHRSVRIVTPYFIPDEALVKAINLASLRGVRVDILLPSENDMLMVRWASNAILWQVLERGCRIWFSPAPFDHSKVVVIDGGWSLVGSANWDPRSFRLNFEFNVECYDEALAVWLENWVDEKIKSAREVTLKEVDSRSLPTRLRDGIARLFAPHL